MAVCLTGALESLCRSKRPQVYFTCIHHDITVSRRVIELQIMTAEDTADVKAVKEHVVNFRISFLLSSYSLCTE